MSDAETGWLQVQVEIAREHCEAVEQLLLEAGALALTLLDAEDHPVLEPAPGETPLWPRVELLALFENDTPPLRILEALCAGGQAEAAARLGFRQIADADWTRAWMDRYGPMRFGRRLWVLPSHHPPPADAAVWMQLDPGLAFGSGTHPTTALCLDWLDGLALAGARVLDWGCGSGILAIAALKLGAASACGVDIDPQALQASQANAGANAVAERLSLYGPDDPGIGHDFDLLVANILAEPLCRLAASLRARLRPGGRFALSGILDGQQHGVEQAWREVGARELVFAEREGWIRISGRV